MSEFPNNHFYKVVSKMETTSLSVIKHYLTTETKKEKQSLASLINL